MLFVESHLFHLAYIQACILASLGSFAAVGELKGANGRLRRFLILSSFVVQKGDTDGIYSSVL